MNDKENYSEIRRVLSNIRSTRIFARETDFELLKEIHEKLGAVIEERRTDVEKAALEKAVREEKRKEILQLIEGEGFTTVELLENYLENSKKRCKKSKTLPKYEYIENNKTKTWTGKGRPPKTISEALNSGHILDEFLIKKNNKQ